MQLHEFYFQQDEDLAELKEYARDVIKLTQLFQGSQEKSIFGQHVRVFDINGWTIN